MCTFAKLSYEQHPLSMWEIPVGMPFKWGVYLTDDNCAQLDDALAAYIAPTTMWLPSYAVLAGRDGYGLAGRGPRLLFGPGARLAVRLFSQWADLFAMAPERIALGSDFDTKVAKSLPIVVQGAIDGGRHGDRVTQYQRDDVVGSLRRVAELAAFVEGHDEAWYLLYDTM